MKIRTTVVLMLSLIVSAKAQTTYYSETFEGTVNMTVVNSPSPGWEFGTPTYGPTTVPQGTRCAGTVLNSSYNNSASYQMTTPAISIPNSSYPVRVSFLSWHELETCCDHVIFEVRQTSSSTWTTLLDTNGVATSWRRRSYDLSGYKNSTIELRFRFTSDGSVVRSGWYVDDIRVFDYITCSMTMNATAGGTTSPTGTTAVEQGIPQPIIATPSLGYRFGNWTAPTGSATFLKADSFSTFTTLTGNATVQANFTPGVVHAITTVDSTYNWTTHAYSGVNGSWGVACSFTPSTSGPYSIIVNEPLKTYSTYIYIYGTNPFSSSSYSTTYATGTVTYTFSATANTTYNFRIYPSSTAYYNNNFTIRYAAAPTLTMTTNGNGSTTPSGSSAVAAGVAQTIYATPNTGYRFQNWTVPSGSATIAKADTFYTTATLTGDATVQANFIPGVVHAITTVDSTYNWTTHAYSGVNGSWGVACSFTPSTSGSYSIIVNEPLRTYSTYIYIYGTNPFTSSSYSSTSGTGTVTYTFMATANTTYNFRIYPSSTAYYNNTFTIRSASAATLTMTNNGNGTTTPAAGASAVTPGVAQTIYATPATGYRFQNWTVTSGSATIAKADTFYTTATLTGDATVQANFIPGVVHAITTVDSTYNWTTHAYSGVNGSWGVACSFTPATTGSYSIIVNEPLKTYSTYVYIYGTNPFTSSSYSSTSGTGTVTYTFSATANTTYNFRIIPSSSAYYNNNFTVRYAAAVTLTMTTNGNGSTTPSGSSTVPTGVAQTIYATPATGYRFQNWTVTSGSATIAKADTFYTTATLAGNATVQANFTPGVVHDITTIDSTYNWTTHAYSGVNGSWGVACSFTPSMTGSYSIIVNEPLRTYSTYLYIYGTNPFSSSSYSSTSGTGTVTYIFMATANTTYNFRITPSSSAYYNNSFTIRYAVAPMLTVISDGHGATTPSGSIAVAVNTATSISASPASAVYYFNRWEVVSGTGVTIASPTSSSTTVTLTAGNATVRALFNSNPHDTLIITNNGKGYTFPKDTLFILDGYDTAVTAVPFGGWLFNSWTTVSGTATITNSTSPTTRVSVPATTGKAAVRANFVINPATIPNVSITDVNIAGHPDICITASVTDTSGRSLAGLDSSSFALSQDQAPVNFQLTSITNMRGASVSLVIDRSGSMGSTEMTYAQESAKSYVRSMNPMDRCAIVSFDDVVQIEQTMTSDTALLIAAINRCTSRNNTAILNGAQQGIAQLVQETNSRTVILFSDGQDNSSTITADSVFKFGRHNSVTIYTIGIGSVSATILQQLADSTGGYYSYSPSASGLAQLYAQIKRDIEAQYILCYRSPDTVFSGDTHAVRIAVTFNNHSGRDTAYWNENNRPPAVALTAATQAMIGVSQPVSSSITIGASVTDDGTVSSVRLYYRRSSAGGGSYTSVPMTLTSGSIYQAVIPAASVAAPGVDFYIIALDNYHLIGRSPNVLTPELQPWVIPVGNDAPLIQYTYPGCSVASTPVSVSPTITDADGILKAILYYKKTSEVFYKTDTMIAGVSNTFSGTIPTAYVLDGTTFYIRAIDTKGAASQNPLGGVYTVVVGNCVLPVANAGPDRTVKANASCQQSVQLNGTGSSGTITGYAWSGPFGAASGVAPNVPLPLGVNTIVLTVTGPVGSTRDTVKITVADSTPPTPNILSLPDARGQCTVTLTPPTASDNCAVGITATTTDPTTYPMQGGPYIVHWTYTDNSGNTASQNQSVYVKDTIPPAISRGADTTVIVTASIAKVFITLKPATASDYCTPTVTVLAARNDGLPLDSGYTVGVTEVKWRACDGGGNCAEAVQKVTVRLNRAPIVTAIADTTIPEKTALSLAIAASDSDGNALAISGVSPLPAGCAVIDSGNGKARLSWNTGCNDHGDYTIKVKAFDGIDSGFASIHVTVTDVNFPPVILDGNVDQHAVVMKNFSYNVHAQDCDGTPLTIRAVNLPTGASFTDNHDGTGSMLWTPAAGEAGYYMVIFEAKDDATAVRDTVIIIVDDENHFAPAITVSSFDTTVGVNLPLTLAVRATVEDGTVPLLRAVSLPGGARFTCDDGGNGVFSWTPNAVGTDSLVLLARHVSDSTRQTVRTVKITVDGRNVTGPDFLAHGDTAVDQNTELALTVEARDPDGAVPQLYLVSAPEGARFVDNGNGSGTFFWKPGCDVAGDFTLRAGATDHYLADSISVGVDVRVVNFPPVFAPVRDISAVPGEMVHILVSAADKCIGSIIPALSVSCGLTGYTFETRGDGTGLFGWKAGSDTGSYPIVFWATNGFATASDTVILSINKTGSVILTTQPKGARIYAMPSGCHAGTYLGCDSAVYSTRPGTYWFEVQASGFRSERIFCEIKPDSTARTAVALKPAIPLMLTEEATFTADTALSSVAAGTLTFVDVNADGLLDLSVISGQTIKTCYQFKSVSDSGFRSLSLDSSKLAAPIAGMVSHVFSDWDNYGAYSCIVGTAKGKILLLKPTKGIFTVAETLCTVTGSKPYPVVVDANRDGKKDLVVHSEGVGIFVFDNTGSDSVPRLGAAREVLSASGASVVDCKGAPLLMDLDQAGSCKWVLASGGMLKTYVTDSALSKITYESDLNCAGARLATDSARWALIGPPQGQPKIAVVKGAAIRLFSTHLLGDVNGDGVVDIRDMSRISKSWELTDEDSSWTPRYNLKLSGSGPEVINISDISRASKCWELKE